MARIVKKINSMSPYGDMTTHTSLDYHDQTPGNYHIDNYYIRELQDKVDAEWGYRPNRALIEYEIKKASDEWNPIEVVLQSVKNEKGKDVSEDFLNLVFRDIQESRFDVGNKFRFSRTHNIKDDIKNKNVWLAINRNTASMTSSVTAQRCNGTLGSRWIDEQGVSHNHYEPAILSGELNSVNLFYNAVADSPQAHLVVITQYNKFTAQYQMNQRFILGARYMNSKGEKVADVYRIKTIDRFYGLTTNDPDNIGLIRIYMEITEASEYDNFEERIAYQEDSVVMLSPEGDNIEYHIEFSEPEHIDTKLLSSVEKFVPIVIDSNGNKYPNLSNLIKTSCELENFPSGVDLSRYVELKEYSVGEENNQYYFTLQRRRIYLNGDLKVSCIIPAEESPNNKEIAIMFKLVVREQEV